MKRLKVYAIGMGLVLTLVHSLLTPAVTATTHTQPHFVLRSDDFTPKTTFVSANPLGMYESIGTVKINGQPMSGRGLFWRGDEVEASASAGTRLTMVGFGSASLQPGTVMRFSTLADTPTSATENTLVVALTAGSVALRLQPGVSAQLKSGASSLLASAGASLRFSLRAQEPVVEVESGNVVPLRNQDLEDLTSISANSDLSARNDLQTQSTQPGYVLKPVGGVRGSAVFDVRARATRQIQIQVTDENDRPVPDVPIIITFGSQLGRFSSTTISSNANGIASVDFTAASQGGQSNFTAQIQGTNITLTGVVVVSLAAAFWSWQTAGPVLGVAATMIVVPTVIVTTRDDNRRIEATGDPAIKP